MSWYRVFVLKMGRDRLLVQVYTDQGWWTAKDPNAVELAAGYRHKVGRVGSTGPEGTHFVDRDTLIEICTAAAVYGHTEAALVLSGAVAEHNDNDEGN